MSTEMVRDCGSDWKLYNSIQIVKINRSGWKGVLDELKATITGKPRFSVASTVTISFYCKGDVEPEVNVTGISLEMGNQIGSN